MLQLFRLTSPKDLDLPTRYTIVIVVAITFQLQMFPVFRHLDHSVWSCQVEESAQKTWSWYRHRCFDIDIFAWCTRPSMTKSQFLIWAFKLHQGSKTLDRSISKLLVLNHVLCSIKAFLMPWCDPSLGAIPCPMLQDWQRRLLLRWQIFDCLLQLSWQSLDSQHFTQTSFQGLKNAPIFLQYWTPSRFWISWTVLCLQADRMWYVYKIRYGVCWNLYKPFLKLQWGEQRWGRSKWGAAWQHRLQEWKGLESSSNLSSAWPELNSSTNHLSWNFALGHVSEIHRNPISTNPLIHAGLCLHHYFGPGPTLGYFSYTDT